MPSIQDLVDPKGTGGRVPGMGVPLTSGATKDDLDKPLQRGVYAVASPDQKTVLKLRVFSKEEANFSPDAVLASPLAESLDEESRGRIRATWTILQLTFEAFDPALYPALRFMLSLASRLGELCQGVIADPLSQVYRVPSSIPSPTPDGQEFEVRDFVSTTRQLGQGNWTFSTAGLAKFDQPEVVLSEVPDAWTVAAESLLLSVAAGVMKGRTLSPGDKLVSEQGWVVAVSGDNVAAQSGIGPARFELLPAGKRSVQDSLADWMQSHGH